MTRCVTALSLLLCFTAASCSAVRASTVEVEPQGIGPYAVGSTNMEVAAGYADIGDEAMHEYLLGLPGDAGQARYVVDVLKHPESAWVAEVTVPNAPALYGPASGRVMPVAAFVTYPSRARQAKTSYAFPYHDASYGIFTDMLGPGALPVFADSSYRYPLIILAHGSSAHGIYDVGHAHRLSSHGYIVAVIFYGDDRTALAEDPNHHVSYLRPLMTRAVVDSLLESEAFGAHIDADNIGISGHSFGGFTALAVAGGPYLGNAATVSDSRIKAGVIAAPWVGDSSSGADFFAFGPGNSGLGQVDIPILCFFGTRDDVTLASFILPAMEQLSGPAYVVELVDQPHIFEQGSWEDRDNWELLFFDAYLKGDPESLATLKVARSMQGGNKDVQRFEYQRAVRRR